MNGMRGFEAWTSVNVAAAFTGLRFLPWWLGIASNNANPSLEIGPDGIRYRVIARSEQSFGTIEQVDVKTAWRTVNLCFRFKGAMTTFSANVRAIEEAARALRLLPDQVPLTERARQIRNG
jgi:hypothetical protein